MSHRHGAAFKPEAQPRIDEKTPLLEEKSASKASPLRKVGNFCMKLTSILPVALFAIGVLALRYFEDWPTLTCVYVIAQIVTTIGYGDFTVTGESAKTFLSVYVCVTLVVLAYCVNAYMGKVVEWHRDALRSHLRSIEIWVDSDVSSPEQAATKYGRINEVLAISALFLTVLLGGAAFFRYYEHCSCSYGLQGVPGCKETNYDTCVASGGFVKGWNGSIYMAIITLSTIGFGDFQPRTYWGRVFGVIWMIAGVVTTGMFLSTMTNYFYQQEHRNKFRKADEVLSHLDPAVFATIDLDGNGTLSRGEFLAFILVKYGVVDQDLMDEVNAVYDRLDVNSREAVTFSRCLAAGYSSDALEGTNSEEA
mmetsp:Transcript_9251/g.20569  ORF Transcript_9251/g.20569 Transcript_9251/m.20569 type:complete len:364 (+) Transcript_9251:117-1208(+)